MHDARMTVLLVTYVLARMLQVSWGSGQFGNSFMSITARTL